MQIGEFDAFLTISNEDGMVAQEVQVSTSLQGSFFKLMKINLCEYVFIYLLQMKGLWTSFSLILEY